MGAPDTTNTRTVGMRELDALSTATSAVRTEMARLQRVAGTALTVTAGALRNGDAGSALNASLAGAAVMLDGRDAVLRSFEKAAFDFFGERPADGEALNDYFSRIAALDEVQLLELQRRNGIVLKI